MKQFNFQHIKQEAKALVEQLDIPYIERIHYEDWPLTTHFSKDSSQWEMKELSNQREELAASIEITNNRTIDIHLSSTVKEQGILITTLEDAAVSHPELMTDYFGSVIPYDRDKLIANNLRHLTMGLFIFIPNQVQIEQPIELKIHSGVSDAFHLRTLLIMGKESQLNFIESLESDSSHSQTFSYVSEVVSQEESALNYCSLDGLGTNTTAYIQREGKLSKQAKLDWSIGVFNDGDVIMEVDSDLIGDHSESEVAAVGISSNHQTQVIDSNVVNHGRQSIGNIIQHGVVLDQARLTMNGIGFIEKGAKMADSQQESRVLMLSEEAHGDANPILLIDEFEVTAGHAASSGQVDADQMYYLMSRGISREVAEYLVIRGFLGPVLTKMPSKQFQQKALQWMDHKLAQDANILAEIGESYE
ncbi:SufD family Fe-S cluster assembly protein [Aerococcaceae bacterium DSM 111020]|nr:SufD family Fe-S cluster assembly protein [Aerococcaceae bacterium DSM 111020]